MAYQSYGYSAYASPTQQGPPQQSSADYSGRLRGGGGYGATPLANGAAYDASLGGGQPGPQERGFRTGWQGNAAMGADPQRAWDLGQLANKLNDMQFAVAATDEALGYKEGPAGSAAGETGGSAALDRGMYVGGGGGYDPGQEEFGGEGAAGQQGSGEAGEEVYIDPSMLPITEGWLYIKGVKESAFALGLSRGWKERFARLEGTDLVFYASQRDDRPKGSFALDGQSTIAPGDAAKKHKNKNVKNDLDVVNGRGELLSLYCDDGDEAGKWMYTLQFCITKLTEAAGPAGDAGPEDGGFGGAAGPAGFGSAALGASGGLGVGGGLPWGSGGDFADVPGDVGGGAPSLRQEQALYGSGGGAGAMPTAEEALEAELQREETRDAAQAHTAYGPGLYEGVRGEPATFHIQANDLATGGPKAQGGDAFVVSIESEHLHFALAPIDMGDGTYQVDYTPTRAGEYELRVTYGGFDIYGSPFHPVVGRARTAASHCLVSGEGTRAVGPAAPAAFTLTARDQFDELRGVGGDAFEVAIIGPGLANPIIDNGDGSYAVSFDVDTDAKAFTDYVAAVAATDGGRGVAPLHLEVHVTLNNDGFPYPRPVAGSPFRPRVVLTEELLAAAVANQSAAAKAAADVAVAAAAASTAADTVAASPLSDVPAASSTAARPPPSGAPSTDGGDATVSAAVAVAAAAAMAEVSALRAQLAARERSIEEGFAALEAARAAVEADRRSVDAQMQRMSELGRTVKEDSERLAEQARSLRAVAAMGAAAAGSPLSVADGGPFGGPGSVASSRALQQPQLQQYQQGGSGDAGSVATGSIARGYAAAQQQGGGYGRGAAGPGSVSLSLDGASAYFNGGGAGYGSGGAAAAASGEGDAPPELFEPEVIGLFDRHKKPLFALWRHYAALASAAAAAKGEEAPEGTTPGVDSRRYVQLFCDYDIAPTFLTRRELKAIFASASRAHGEADGAGGDDVPLAPLSYAVFMEALGRTALAALSKPAFTHLYPAARDKVAVLLEMWGLADPRKLAEVQRRPQE